MALPPQNDEAFLREVDEELRRDQIGTFWRRYGKLVAGLIIGGLLAFGGFLWWEAQQIKATGLASEQFNAALDDLANGKTADAEKTLNTISTGKNDGYRAVAKLTLAAQKMQTGDNAGAATAYKALAADDSAGKPFQDLALIRATAAEFDTMKPQAVIDQLKPLAIPGGPWFGSAGEMTAVAWLKLNRPDKAGAIFNAIAKDKTVPESIRARSVRIAGALGVDATAKPAVAGKE